MYKISDVDTFLYKYSMNRIRRLIKENKITEACKVMEQSKIPRIEYGKYSIELKE